MFSTADTIVAIATPPGKGGIGVVRLSGPHAPDIASQLIDRPTPLEPRHATFTSVRMARETVDQVVATYFPAPHSYTGDDVVEISGHGSPVLLERIVALAIATGARLAEPGEFTLRAFLNGRIDLVQAEAVADVIDAVTPQQARAALDQLDGTLTSVIRRADLALLDLIAKCEASLDFPDEGFHFIEQDEARDLLERVASDLRSLLASAAHGRLLREGRTVALAGRPNTGKSSLFNALLGRNRAIVTNLPGTTRDLLTERVDMLGVPVTLIDTAGVRVSDDPIEQEGVSRAAAARAGAAMTLVVLDLSTPLTSTDRSLIEETEAEPRLVVANKCDQPAAWSFDSEFPQLAIRRVSAESGEGLDELRRAIAGDVVQRDEHRDTPTLTNLRHVTLAQSALDAVVRASTAMQAGATEELVLIDLHDARERLEEITGRRTADDVLAHIFAKFCVGK